MVEDYQSLITLLTAVMSLLLTLWKMLGLMSEHDQKIQARLFNAIELLLGRDVNRDGIIGGLVGVQEKPRP